MRTGSDTRGWVSPRLGFPASAPRCSASPPSDPGRGASAGWRTTLGEPGRRSRGALGAQNAGAGAALGGPRTPLLANAGVGGCVGRSEGLSSPLCVCLSPCAERSSNKFCISAINFSHYSRTNQHGPSRAGAGLAVKVVPGAGRRGPPPNPHLANSRVPRAGLARGSGAGAPGARALASRCIGVERAQAPNGGSLALFTPFLLAQLPTPQPPPKRDLRGGQGAGRWVGSGAGRSDNGVARHSSWTRRGKSLSTDCASARGEPSALSRRRLTSGAQLNRPLGFSWSGKQPGNPPELGFSCSHPRSRSPLPQ